MFSRFTILLNNMRLMGIFDWWTGVLEFISQAADNPNPPPTSKHHSAEAGSCQQPRTAAKHQRQPSTASFLEEPLYPTAGIVSRRAPVLETASGGPVFELKLNVTDSELVIVADASQVDTSTVILRSTTVIAYRPGFIFVQHLCGSLSHLCHLENCVLSTSCQMPQTITNIPCFFRRL